LDSDVKKDVEAVYSRYGLSLAEAVTVFIYQSRNVGGLPFDLRPAQVNTETLAAIDEANRISRDPSVKGYRNMDELFKDLEADE
jgi:DNA-damage-inducible protein J